MLGIGNFSSVAFHRTFYSVQDKSNNPLSEKVLIDQTKNVGNPLRVLCSPPGNHLHAFELITSISNGLSDSDEYLSFPSNSSCIIEDFKNENIWMLSDAVGQYPLWYSISASENSVDDARLLITTDYLYARHLSNYFEDLTALGPGLIMKINMTSYDIEYLEKWSAPTSKNVEQYDIPSQSQNMLSSLLESFSRKVGGFRERGGLNSTALYMLEADPSDYASSSLSVCILDALESSHYVFHSKPLTGLSIRYDDIFLSKITGSNYLKNH